MTEADSRAAWRCPGRAAGTRRSRTGACCSRSAPVSSAWRCAASDVVASGGAVRYGERAGLDLHDPRRARTSAATGSARASSTRCSTASALSWAMDGCGRSASTRRPPAAASTSSAASRTALRSCGCALEPGAATRRRGRPRARSPRPSSTRVLERDREVFGADRGAVLRALAALGARARVVSSASGGASGPTASAATAITPTSSGPSSRTTRRRRSISSEPCSPRRAAGPSSSTRAPSRAGSRRSAGSASASSARSRACTSATARPPARPEHEPRRSSDRSSDEAAASDLSQARHVSSGP